MKISKICSVKFFNATGTLGSPILVGNGPAGVAEKICTSSLRFFRVRHGFLARHKGVPYVNPWIWGVPSENSDRKEVQFFSATPAGRFPTKIGDPRVRVALKNFTE